jgi:hypothetical protein
VGYLVYPLTLTLSRKGRGENQGHRKKNHFVCIINQGVIVWTLETKSLLPSLYKREEFPSLKKRG